MVRWCSVAYAVILLIFGALVGCGSTSRPSSGPVPASISITPSGASMDLGTTQPFTASAQDFNNRPIVVALSFSSSNTGVLTIANSGVACAGSWDSLTAPVVCTPGPAGVAQVMASAAGVVSPPVTVYVHEHVDNITVKPINPPTVPCLPGNPGNPVGLSQNQTVTYQAAALSRNNDVTATVGPFTWNQTNTTVTKLTTNTAAANLLQNQAQVTANSPGITQITASAGDVTSTPVAFMTCPVQSITLQVNAASGSVATGTSETITATVVDSLGTTLTTAPSLTWNTSEPTVVSVGTATGFTQTASAQKPGGSDVIASCTPPTCNVGFESDPAIKHSLPIYPAPAAIALTVEPSSSSTSTQTTSAFVTSKDCGTNFGCTTSIVPITIPANQVGNGTTLPNTPNSMLFDRQGKNLYLGSENGLMMVTAANVGTSSSAVTTFNKVTGKVLAVSPNGNKIIVSEMGMTPNQVFVFDQTTPTNIVNLLIVGATAAAFSPDNLKAYIVGGSTLNVYSTVEALQTIALTGPANDVAFLPVGAFAYLAGGGVLPNNSDATVTVRNTCDNQPATDGTNKPILPTQGIPTAIRALVDGTHLLALDPPGLDIITASPVMEPKAPITCPPTISNAGPQFVNLGQGQFTPIKFLVSSDGRKAYILASNIGAVLVFDTAALTSSAIPLSGNVTPLDGDMTLDGTMIYVSASDGKVHAVSTVSGGDLQQISFPTNLCNNVGFSCTPNLLAIEP